MNTSEDEGITTGVDDHEDGVLIPQTTEIPGATLAVTLERGPPAGDAPAGPADVCEACSAPIPRESGRARFPPGAWCSTCLIRLPYDDDNPRNVWCSACGQRLCRDCVRCE